MKHIKRFFLSLVIIFSAVAFIPVFAFPWMETINWDSFAFAYNNLPITFNVNTTEDAVDANPGDRICAAASGLCSLRAAITEANLLDDLQADVIIILPSGIYIVGPAFNGAEYSLYLDRASQWRTFIQGQRANDTIISGEGYWAGIFDLSYSVTISDVTITKGEISSSRAGAFFVRDYSDLLIKDSIINDHYGVEGGAINTWYPHSYITLENSTIFDSTAEKGGGAIYNENGIIIIRNSLIYGNNAGSGGGIYSKNGTLILENSTISGNNASTNGGGLSLINGDAKLFSSTIYSNIAETGGGVHLEQTTSAKFGVSNTILAGNLPSGSPDCKIVGSGIQFQTNGYNLIGSLEGCDMSWAATDKVNPDIFLGILADNGGNTRTHALMHGSPAINGGDPSGCLDSYGNVLTHDQRLFPRPSVRWDARCDIGAYEWNGWAYVFLPFLQR